MALRASPLFAALLAASPADAAVNVSGGGSTDAQILIDQWRADIARQGVSVNYVGVGAPSGRQLYISGVYDFAVSELPFSASEQSGAAQRPYRYVPVTAMGIGLMYHLTVNGTMVPSTVGIV